MEMFPRPAGLTSETVESVGNFLARHRVLFLHGPIMPVPHRWDVYGPSVVMNLLMALSIQDPDQPIWLVIESPGGDVETGFHLYDVMKTIPAPVYTVGQSCASMASVILSGGEPGHRYVYRNSRTMIHLPRMSASGDSKDFENHSREMKRVRDMLVGAYVENGATKGAKEILKDMDRDTWFSADETIKYGLADAVVDSDVMSQILAGHVSGLQADLVTAAGLVA